MLQGHWGCLGKQGEGGVCCVEDGRAYYSCFWGNSNLGNFSLVGLEGQLTGKWCENSEKVFGSTMVSVSARARCLRFLEHGRSQPMVRSYTTVPPQTNVVCTNARIHKIKHNTLSGPSVLARVEMQAKGARAALDASSPDPGILFVVYLMVVTCFCIWVKCDARVSAAYRFIEILPVWARWWRQFGV